MLNFHNKLTALRDKQKSDEGFTLIELLVVVLIIGVLAAIAIPIFLTQQTQAEEAGYKADLANAKIAYVSQLVNAPTATPTLTQLQSNGYSGASTITITSATDPKTFCLAIAPWAVTSTGGVVKGTCAAGVLTAATP